MKGKRGAYPNWQTFLLLLILGGIVGGWIGDAMIKIWPVLATWGRVHSIGIPSFTLDLKVFTLSFGFMLRINLFTIIGFVAAYFIYKRI
ncbi:DUF4321 domain-containing protein [Syntrophomonas erecta]